MQIVSIRHHKKRVESQSSLSFQQLSPLDLAVWEMGDFTSDSTLEFFLKKPGGFIHRLNPVVDSVIRKSPKSNVTFLALPV